MGTDELYFPGAFLSEEDEQRYNDAREQQLYDKALQVAIDGVVGGITPNLDHLDPRDRVIMRLAFDLVEARGIHSPEETR